MAAGVQTEDPPRRRLSIEGVNCVICQATPREHHICCVNGHGGCVGCITREKLRTALCPMCRLPMLDRLIPNLSLNDAVAATETDTTAPARAPVSQATPPSSRRPRDPEAERAAKLRRVQQLYAAAEALQAGPLTPQKGSTGLDIASSQDASKATRPTDDLPASKRACSEKAGHGRESRKGATGPTVTPATWQSLGVTAGEGVTDAPALGCHFQECGR